MAAGMWGGGGLLLSKPGTCGFPGKKQQVTPTCCCRDCAVTSAVSWGEGESTVRAGPGPGKSIPLSTRAGAPQSQDIPLHSHQMASPQLAFSSRPRSPSPCFCAVALFPLCPLSTLTVKASVSIWGWSVWWGRGVFGARFYLLFSALQLYYYRI